jgi:hypothetical protein
MAVLQFHDIQKEEYKIDISSVASGNKERVAITVTLELVFWGYSIRISGSDT